MVRRVAVIHVAALLHMYLRAHEPRRHGGGVQQRLDVAARPAIC